MRWSHITKTQNDEAWLSDYIADVLQREAATLPPHDQWVGHVEVHWHQIKPGVAYMAANPDQGTVADRQLAEDLVWSRLANRGFKRAGMDRTAASWGVSEAVEDSARRLVQTGAVHLDLNTQPVVMAHVDGDGTDNNGVPDVHEVEIRRQDPQDPEKVTGAFCNCTWGQFLNTPRTRQWKDYQKTPCKHIVATDWVAMSVPREEKRAPGDYGEQGQMQLPGMGTGGEAPGRMPTMQQAPMGNPNAWWNQPGAPPNQIGQTPQNAPGGAAPPPEAVLPQFPMEQMEMQMPPVNPASTPGGRPGPTPTNPLQYPGGTFSSIHSAVPQYKNGDSVIFLNDVEGMVRMPSDTWDPTFDPNTSADQQPGWRRITIPKGEGGEVRGQDPTTGLVEVLSMDKTFDQFGRNQPFGATVHVWPSEIRPSGLRAPAPNVRRI